jgi:glycerol-3-phosphate dehydrogenase
MPRDHQIAVVGAGVVGSACALALARRGAAVVVLEAEDEPGLGASGENSGILHTGFDSTPGELETELILRSARLRAPVLEALGVPVLDCGAQMRPLRPGDEDAIAALARNARANGVAVDLRPDGRLEVPGERVTDPVAYTLGLAAAAQRHGAELRTRFAVAGLRRADGAITVSGRSGEEVRVEVVVNCAGLGASEVARLAGDDSFEVFPRKGEFLVFEPPAGVSLDSILLPVPSERTKGVLVFPTVDGTIIAGPTAIDQEDPRDRSVRPQASDEIRPAAEAMFPPLASAEPVFSYAGLRPTGRGVNYHIGTSPALSGLVNVAAIRSTGLTASLGIAERVCELVAEQGVALGRPQPLAPAPPAPGDGPPWWRRNAEHRSG